MHYLNGQLQALKKLGMVAPIPYVSTRTRDADMANANTKQEFWKNFDSEPLNTGEESSHGMPSAPKTGSENDYGYSNSPGLTPIGGRDANQDLVDRNKRLSDAMQQAFAANEDYDQSYAPESPSTQPHGPKMAANFAAPRMIGAPRSTGPAMRNMGSVPRLGTNSGARTQGMTFNAPNLNAFKAPTNLSPALKVQNAGHAEARATVSTAQPTAVGATGSSRMSTTPTLPGGAPVNPVPAMPNLTISAPPTNARP